MTIEAKKKWLGRYKALKIEVQTYAEELETLQLNQMLPSVVQGNGDYIQGGPLKDSMVDYMVKYDELITKILKAQNESIKRYQEISDCIDSLENPLYRLILRQHYILCRDWETVAINTSYSIQRIYQLACEALSELDIPTE